MRFMGHNVLAILVAAIAIYAIEFVIFAVLIDQQQYLAMTGISAEQMTTGQARMPFGIMMPILAAIGLSLAIKWHGAPGWLGGARTAALMAVFFAFAASMYSFVYGSANETFLLVSLVHFVIAYAAAGAILGAWK